MWPWFFGHKNAKHLDNVLFPELVIMAPFAKYLGQRHSRGDSLPVEASLSIKEFQTP